jgi:hypothetical protein
MISDRLLAWLAARAGLRVTRWSVLRIAVFSVAALVLLSMVLPGRPVQVGQAPYNATLATRDTRNVALPLGDTRGFAPSHRPSRYQVAWIGGSETLAVGAKTRAFIPALVTERIGKVDGRRVSTDIYYLNAIRLADQLAALSTALASKPDLVVVSLNPVWVMNDLAVQQWGYLDGELAQHSAWPPSRWPVAASLVGPGDVGWKLLSGISPDGIGDRYDWGVDLAQRTGGLTFLDPVPGARQPPPTGLAAVGQMRPVDFFFSRFTPSNPSTDLTTRQLAILERQAASRSDVNEVVLGQMLDMVRRAGVEAYFYVPPINPEVYAEPEAKTYLADLRTKLADVSEGRIDKRVAFDPQGLQDRVPVTSYQDIVHVLDGRPEATVLSRDICDLITANGRRPGCEDS